MKIRSGMFVLVRPGVLHAVDADTVFRVCRTVVDDISGTTPPPIVSLIVHSTRELYAPRFLEVNPDDVIEYVYPPERPPEPRDVLTGLTATEEATAYRQRRDANLYGTEPLPPLGWDDAALVFRTPHGPITLQTIRAFEGTLFASVPDQIRPALEWLCHLVGPLRGDLAAASRNERMKGQHVHD
jgi:hypothetical protein